jgi:hypothetical protein
MGGNYKASHLRKTTGQGYRTVQLSLHYFMSISAVVADAQAKGTGPEAMASTQLRLET